MNIIDTFQDAAYAAPITNFQDSCLRVPNWARALTPRYASPEQQAGEPAQIAVRTARSELVDQPG